MRALQAAGYTVTGRANTSSHGLGVPEAVELGEALDRLPERLVVLTVEAADIGYGLGLTEPVAAAVPALVADVLAEFRESASPPSTAP